MRKIDSRLFEKFEMEKMDKEIYSKILGGKTRPIPGGTTNDCTGTGGDCWDHDCGTNVVDDATWTGGKDNGDDTCN
ncbi:hypothetical protein [Flavobacterium sp. '19STA2R22 D10 B1']|uniref:hypothetical protein n=1 Tax=Flavobacterium aerium TaxID=3037261 RepID=UPI00278BCBE3|nr:hypothetical protein [Flavobacterium sp. '19STA2R22 D10 B1']